MRLPMNANSEFEVRQYYQTRALQLASEGYVWDRTLVPFNDGDVYLTYFTKDGDDGGFETFGSFYITESARGKGLATKAHDALGVERIVTVKDCDVEAYLIKKGIPHVVVPGAYDSHAYSLIQSFYGDQRAKRSQVFLMNHIDEGIIILRKMGASEDVISAYALHPMTQGDAELSENLDKLVNDPLVSKRTLALCLEYRNHANAWLSAKVTADDECGFTFSGRPSYGPLTDTQLMLIADKVQNYKDFILYHRDTHARSPELTAYFNEWLKVLEVDDIFPFMCAELVKTSPHI